MIVIPPTSTVEPTLTISVPSGCQPEEVLRVPAAAAAYCQPTSPFVPLWEPTEMRIPEQDVVYVHWVRFVDADCPCS